MAFAFTQDQRDGLFVALGRDDSGAWHLVEDVELALDAFAQAAQAAEGTIDPAVEFAQIRGEAGHLRMQLYGLPERVRQLAVLGAIGSDYAADVARLAQVGGEALEQLSLKLAEVGTPVADTRERVHTPAERFVHAVGQAFRNRLNIKPTIDAHGLFRRFLSALIDNVGRRHTDLDDLSRSMDDVRLAHILGSD